MEEKIVFEAPASFNFRFKFAGAAFFAAASPLWFLITAGWAPPVCLIAQNHVFLVRTPGPVYYALFASICALSLAAVIAWHWPRFSGDFRAAALARLKADGVSGRRKAPDEEKDFAVSISFYPRRFGRFEGYIDDSDDVGVLELSGRGVVFRGDSSFVSVPSALIASVEFDDSPTLSDYHLCGLKTGFEFSRKIDGREGFSVRPLEYGDLSSAADRNADFARRVSELFPEASGAPGNFYFSAYSRLLYPARVFTSWFFAAAGFNGAFWTQKNIVPALLLPGHDYAKVLSLYWLYASLLVLLLSFAVAAGIWNRFPWSFGILSIIFGERFRRIGAPEAGYGFWCIGLLLLACQMYSDGAKGRRLAGRKSS